MQTFKKLLFILTPAERKRAGLLLIITIIMALLDMVGIASILPFMAVLTNPSVVETNIIFNKIYQSSNIFGVETNQEFIFFLGVIVLVLLIFSLIFKAFTVYVQVRFTEMREYSISKRLIEGYLNQPYSWFLSRHSADLGKTILSQVGQLIGNGIRPLIELISKSIVTISIIILLVIVDLKLALAVGLSLGSAYLLIFYFVRKFLNHAGEKRLKNNELRFRLVSEAFGAAKEVKVGGLEKSYIRNFSNYAQIYAMTEALSQVIAQLPRFILEAIAFGGILIIILYIIAERGDFNSALPIISLYVFAGYRLMPAVQGIYSSLVQLTFIGPSLNNVYEDLQNLRPINLNLNHEVLTFNKIITLNNIYYDYPNRSIPALKNLSLSIPIKSVVGLVGATGSGKTTTIDIILGLLETQKGTLEVDGKVITKQNIRSWQRSIGYVPQHIYLSEDTIEANIAFGVETKDINKNMVEKAAKVANLHKFVIEELPKQYYTTIGERGVRLSGGQRQKIGIARALYRNPQVLILDEATSALDNQTEQVVMDAVNNLSGDITIILIAHRLNTVRNCDIIYQLDKGQIIGQGTFDKLISSIEGKSI
jgi:ABC-type multidrug transport system fused ATPase/permease subunit